MTVKRFGVANNDWLDVLPPIRKGDPIEIDKDYIFPAGTILDIVGGDGEGTVLHSNEETVSIPPGEIHTLRFAKQTVVKVSLHSRSTS